MRFWGLIFLLSFWGVRDVAGRSKIMYSDYAADKMPVDADERKWMHADSVYFEGSGAGSENRVIVKSLWNEDFLFLLFRVYDENLQSHETEQDHPKLFLDDMVEFLIDPYNHKDSCWFVTNIVYHINLLGTKKDDRGTSDCLSDPSWNGNAQFVVKLSGTLNNSKDRDFGYVVEVAVPWGELRAGPHEGMVMGINFANGDNDGKGRQLFDWAGVFPLRSPHRFGNLVLRKE